MHKKVVVFLHLAPSTVQRNTKHKFNSVFRLIFDGILLFFVLLNLFDSFSYFLMSGIGSWIQDVINYAKNQLRKTLSYIKDQDTQQYAKKESFWLYPTFTSFRWECFCFIFVDYFIIDFWQPCCVILSWVYPSLIIKNCLDYVGRNIYVQSCCKRSSTLNVFF